MDNESLVADLVEFVSSRPRAYEEVMDAWRTSCPRLAIWEDAVDNGLLSRKGRMVVVTDKGKRFVQRLRPDSVRQRPLAARDTSAGMTLPNLAVHEAVEFEPIDAYRGVGYKLER